MAYLTGLKKQINKANQYMSEKKEQSGTSVGKNSQDTHRVACDSFKNKSTK